MAAIPVHTSSPINPNAPSKASSATPSTATTGYSSSAPPAALATTTTIDARPYPAAQPGAPSAPQPTGSATRQLGNPAPSPTRTAQATATMSANPPQPQPGAVPSPYTTQAGLPNLFSPAQPQPSNAATANNAASSTNAYTPTKSFASPVPLPQHQQSPHLHTPMRSVPPASTTTFTHPFQPQSGPSTFHLQTADLSHPPGYQQSRGSFDDSVYPMPNNNTTSSNMVTPRKSFTGRGVGILDDPQGYNQLNPHNKTEGAATEEEGGIWDKAVAWAKIAGKKLSHGEEQIWQSINGEK